MPTTPDADPEAGCPFAPGVPERTKAGVAEVLARHRQAAAEEVWALDGGRDRLGVRRHARRKAARRRLPALCRRLSRLPAGSQGLKPADFGAADWDDVKPFDSYAKDFKLEAADRATGLRAYHTGMFVNYATAKLFTPLRDALAELNREKQKALDARETDTPAVKRPCSTPTRCAATRS